MRVSSGEEAGDAGGVVEAVGKGGGGENGAGGLDREQIGGD